VYSPTPRWLRRTHRLPSREIRQTLRRVRLCSDDWFSGRASTWSIPVWRSAHCRLWVSKLQSGIRRNHAVAVLGLAVSTGLGRRDEPLDLVDGQVRSAYLLNSEASNHRNPTRQRRIAEYRETARFLRRPKPLRAYLGRTARFAAATFRVTGGHRRTLAGAIAHIAEITIAGFVARSNLAVIIVTVMAIVSLGWRNR
jgi:hypothetical protein